MGIVKPLSLSRELSVVDSTPIAAVNRVCSISKVRKVKGTLLTLILVASALSFLGTGSSGYNAYAQDNRNNNLDVQVSEPSPGITAQWWQWIMSIPVDENPTTDTTGEDCSQGDFGDTFFLAGNLGGKTERECTITEGQDILIPIVNTICIKTEPPETQESLLAICKDFTAQTKNLQLIIDGKHVRNLESFRVTNSEFFTIDAVDDNIFEPLGLPAGSYNAVADGYWALIEGLSAGEHDITIVGKQHGHFSTGEKWDFKTDVTYHITVEEA
jgi:hypothetical protein